MSRPGLKSLPLAAARAEPLGREGSSRGGVALDEKEAELDVARDARGLERRGVDGRVRERHVVRLVTRRQVGGCRDRAGPVAREVARKHLGARAVVEERQT